MTSDLLKRPTNLIEGYRRMEASSATIAAGVLKLVEEAKEGGK